ncbi:LOW QUALITY PROTEIN: hypothetical protein QYF61_012078, partial [Mycteria americana]
MSSLALMTIRSSIASPQDMSTCCGMGSSMGCSVDMYSNMDLHGLQGTTCVTMVFTTGCRKIFAPVVVESDKVSPQPPFLQAKQPQYPQLLLTRLTLHQLHCPSLDTVQHLNVPLVVGGPKLNSVFEGDDHFPSPAGHAIFDTSQDAIGFLGHLGTLLAHIQVAVNQHSHALFCQAAFQPLFPKPVALPGVVVTQVQDLALGLVEPHTTGPILLMQPVQVPLQSLPPLKQINTPTQLGVICKLTEGALDPFIQIIDKDIKQDWPQHRALGDTTCSSTSSTLQILAPIPPGGRGE